MTIAIILFLFTVNGDPPGTIFIKGHFVDRTEIQNIHWLEFIYHKSQELDSVQVQKLLPDRTNTWYAEYENRYLPVVLITYEQALEYCAWRSEVVSQTFGRKVTYRLPTPIEWRNIAEEVYRVDARRVEEELRAARKVVLRDTVKIAYNAVRIPESRVYNMFDNVSEMTATKGTAMGFNNSKLADVSLNLSKRLRYESANAYLGFRCVAEVED